MDPSPYRNDIVAALDRIEELEHDLHEEKAKSGRLEQDRQQYKRLYEEECAKKTFLGTVNNLFTNTGFLALVGVGGCAMLLILAFTVYYCLSLFAPQEG